MEHTNQIAIDVLNDEYADYNVKPEHYNREYEMIVKALDRQTVSEKDFRELLIKGQSYVVPIPNWQKLGYLNTWSTGFRACYEYVKEWHKKRQGTAVT